MTSTGITPSKLVAYQRKHQRISLWLSIIGALVFITYVALGLTTSNYSFKTSIELLTHLQDYRQSAGGIDPAVVRILAINVAIAAVCALTVLLTAIFAIKSFNKSRVIVEQPSARRQSFTQSGSIVTAETEAAPLRSRQHANFNNTNPLPTAVPSTPAVVTPARPTYAEPEVRRQPSPVASAEHIFAPGVTPKVPEPEPTPEPEPIRMNLPPGMSIPAGLNIPSNVILTPADAPVTPTVAPQPEPQAIASESTSPVEELFDIEEEAVPPAHKHASKRRESHIAPSKGSIRLPSNARLVLIFLAAGIVAGVSGAIAIMATNRITSESDGTYVQRETANSIGLSPTFMGDLLQGMFNPQAALLWLMTAVVIVMGIQVFALTSIASIMLKNSRRRLNALDGIM